MLRRLRETLGQIADELLKRTDDISGAQPEEKSILGQLSNPKFYIHIGNLYSITPFVVKAERASNELQMSREEILAQVRRILRCNGIYAVLILVRW